MPSNPGYAVFGEGRSAAWTMIDAISAVETRSDPAKGLANLPVQDILVTAATQTTMTPAPTAMRVLDRWWRHLSLAWPLAKRDMLARYRGSVVGVLGRCSAPLAMVGIYALVFRASSRRAGATP